MAFAATAAPGVAGFNGAYQEVYNITALAADEGIHTFNHTLGVVPTEYWIEEMQANLAGATHMTRWSIGAVSGTQCTINKTCIGAGPAGSTNARVWLRVAHSVFIGA